MKRTLVRATAIGALAIGLTLVVAACGGGDDSSGVASLNNGGQTTTNGSSESGEVSPKERRQAELEYAKCMREHGIDFPDPVDGQFNLKSKRGDQRKLEEAQKACQGILRDVAPKLSEEQQAELREAAVDFAKCMREHGVDMPDPTFPAGGGMLMRMPLGADDDPAVEKARKACQPILDAAEPPGGLRGRDS